MAFRSMERTTCVHASGAWINLSDLSMGTGIVRRFLGSLAPRHDLLQHSAHHDIMVVVTGDTRGGAIARAGAPRGYVFT